MSDLQDQLDVHRQKVDVEHFDITVRELVRMADEGELEIAPAFQRKFRWREKDESRLIESLFLGLPIPPVFVASNKDGTWEVIDGLQRISSLIHLLSESSEALGRIERKNNLVIEGLEKLTYLNGLSYEDMPTNVQLLLNKRSLRVTVLSDKSDYDIRFEMFERLNRGGLILTDQEVRSCVYRGEFIDLIEKLSSDDDLRTLVKLQRKKEADGTRGEFVVKFFAYLYQREKFSGSVVNFLNAFCMNHRTKLPTEANARLFRKTIQHMLKATGGGPLLRAKVNTTPLNQLEGVAVGIAELLNGKQALKVPRSGWQDDELLVSFCRGGTNTKASLNGRINRAKELFSE